MAQDQSKRKAKEMKSTLQVQTNERNLPESNSVTTDTGDFLIEGPLGGGHTAQVFKVKARPSADHDEGQLFAIKVSIEPSHEGDDIEKRFRGEYDLLRELGKNKAHQVPRVDSVGHTKDGRIFFVMELMDPTCQTLASKLRSVSWERGEREKLAMDAAIQYVWLIQTLHHIGRAAPDRKIDDLMWDDKRNPPLVVLDWNLVPEADESGKLRDLYQFGEFWYELLIGEPPTLGQDRSVIEIDAPEQWRKLTWGTQQILRRALQRAPAQRYHHAEELLQDLREQQRLLRESPEVLLKEGIDHLERYKKRNTESEDLQQAISETQQAITNIEQALAMFDIVRLHHDYEPEQARTLFTEALNLRENLVESLRHRAMGSLRNGFYEEAIEGFRRTQDTFNNDPAKLVQSERWLLLAEFCTRIQDEAIRFRNEVLPRFINILQYLENEDLENAERQFWSILRESVADKLSAPAFFEWLDQARDAHAQGDVAKMTSAFHQATNLQSELFANWLSLLTATENGLLYMISEIVARKMDGQAQARMRTGDFVNAYDLYQRIQRLEELIPYHKELIEAGLLAQSSAFVAWTGKLGKTVQEAQRCLEEAQDAMRTSNFADALEKVRRGLGLVSEPPPANIDSAYWSLGKHHALVLQLEKARQRAAWSLDLQKIVNSPNLEDLLPAACAKQKRLLDAFSNDAWAQEQRHLIKQALIAKLEVESRVRLQERIELKLATEYFGDDSDVRDAIIKLERSAEEKAHSYKRELESLSPRELSRNALEQALILCGQALVHIDDAEFLRQLRQEDTAESSADNQRLKTEIENKKKELEGKIQDQSKLHAQFEQKRRTDYQEAIKILRTARDRCIKLYDDVTLDELERELSQHLDASAQSKLTSAIAEIEQGNFDGARKQYEEILEMDGVSKQVKEQAQSALNSLDQQEQNFHEFETKCKALKQKFESQKQAIAGEDELEHLDKSNRALQEIHSQCQSFLADWRRTETLSINNRLFQECTSLRDSVLEQQKELLLRILQLVDGHIEDKDWHEAERAWHCASTIAQQLVPDDQEMAGRLEKQKEQIVATRKQWLAGVLSKEEDRLAREARDFAMAELYGALLASESELLKPVLEALEENAKPERKRVMAEIVWVLARKQSESGHKRNALHKTEKALGLIADLLVQPDWKSEAENLRDRLKNQIAQVDAKFEEKVGSILEQVEKGNYSIDESLLTEIKKLMPDLAADQQSQWRQLQQAVQSFNQMAQDWENILTRIKKANYAPEQPADEREAECPQFCSCLTPALQERWDKRQALLKVLGEIEQQIAQKQYALSQTKVDELRAEFGQEFGERQQEQLDELRQAMEHMQTLSETSRENYPKFEQVKEHATQVYQAHRTLRAWGFVLPSSLQTQVSDHIRSLLTKYPFPKYSCAEVTILLGLTRYEIQGSNQGVAQ
jgi:serine/threonine protein kinase